MSNFVRERIKSIIFYPGYEWKVIAAEKRSLKEDFFAYSLTLIILGGASKALGSFFFVRNVLDIDAYRFSFPLSQAFSFILIQIVTVLILTFFIHGVALKFASVKDFVKSGKLVIYGLTPLFLCYIIANLDSSMILALIPAFYSLFLFAKGLPVMINTRNDKVPTFTFLIALMALGINYILEVGFSILIHLIFPDISLIKGL
ncbi:MAG TPA: Yip1 family protein [Lentimicrobium sp.]|jgi:hypothetical protein|nr:Yip1 family protein [Lentimicrobium sp.]